MDFGHQLSKYHRVAQELIGIVVSHKLQQGCDAASSRPERFSNPVSDSSATPSRHRAPMTKRAREQRHATTACLTIGPATVKATRTVCNGASSPSTSINATSGVPLGMPRGNHIVGAGRRSIAPTIEV